MIAKKELAEEMIISKTEKLMKEIKKEKYADFEETINLLEELEDFFSHYKGEYTTKEIEGFLDNLIDMYKNKLKSKELTKEQQRLLNNGVNFLIMTFGYIPITLEGKDMSQSEFGKWKQTVWKEHLKEQKEEPKEIKQVEIEEYREILKKQMKQVYAEEPEAQMLIELLAKEIVEEGQDLDELLKEFEIEKEDLKKALKEIFEEDPLVVSAYKIQVEKFIKENNVKIDFDIAEWVMTILVEVMIELILEQVKKELLKSKKVEEKEIPKEKTR